ncbi:MAG: hypothetical protein U0570_12055 [Phycisphaerales bacterium]
MKAWLTSKTVWLGALGGAAALATIWWATAPEKRWTNGAEIRASVRGAPVRQILWQPATPAQQGSGEEDRYEPKISADGSTMVFVRRRAGANADLFESRWNAGAWGEPRAIEAINTEQDELGPELSSDGKSLYFYSDRPGGVGGYDLWVSRQKDGAWQAPENCGRPINTEANEYGPALAPDGKTLFFASNRARPGEKARENDAWPATMRERRERHDYDLYRARVEEPADVVALVDLNTEADEGAPAMSPAADFLYFASDRAGGLGGFDVYRARARGDLYGAIENLGGAVNSKDNDLDPGLSADGFRLYFSSDRAAQADGAKRYSLWSTASREVYVEADESNRLAALWNALVVLSPWIGALLAALAALALAGWMLRSELWRRRLARLSLLAQCVLISLLVHAMITAGLAVWKVGAGLADVMRSGGGTRVVLASAGGAGDVASQFVVSGGETESPGPVLEVVKADVASAVSPGVGIELPPMVRMAGEKMDVRSEAAPDAARSNLPVAAESAVVAAMPQAKQAERVAERETGEVARDPGAAPQQAPLSGGLRASDGADVRLPGMERRAEPLSVNTSVESGGASSPAAPSGSGVAGLTSQTEVGAALPRNAGEKIGGAEASVGEAGGATNQVAAPVSAGGVRGGEGPALPLLENATKIGVDVKPAEVGSNGGAATLVKSDASGAVAGGERAALPASVAGAAKKEEASVGTGTIAGGGAAAPVSASGVRGGEGPALPMMGGATKIGVEAKQADVASAGGSAGRLVAASETSQAGGSAALPASVAGASRKEEARVGGGSIAGGGAAAPVAAGVRGEAGTLVLPGGAGPERLSLGAAKGAEMTGPMVASGSRPFVSGSVGESRLPAQIPEPVNPVETFDQRAPEARGEMLARMGGSAETEKAVGRALEWFAKHQQADGRWSAKHFDDGCGRCGTPAEIDADAAMTGIVLLCYLGAGHTHMSDGPYRDAITKALTWVIRRQGADGDLRRGETMYGQTLCAVAMCEALSMTKDPNLAAPARKAAEFVVRSAMSGRSGRDEDTSVLGWLVMTVESARRAGIAMPPDVFAEASRWLESVSSGNARGRYATSAGGSADASMTAEAMFVQQILGHRRDEARMKESAEFVLAATPKWDGAAPTYHWYYATLALFEQQGDAWKQWNERLSPVLVEHQRTDGAAAGSWDPQDEWSRLGGRIYQTAVCTLSLEVYYRYKPR